MKTCTKCGTLKAASEFYKFVRSKDGLAPWCKVCKKVSDKDYYAANSQRIIDRVMAREKAQGPTERAKKYRLAYTKEWRKRNADAVVQQIKTWRNANPDRTRAMISSRRAAKLQATPAWANKEKIAEFYFAADFLSMVTGEWHHVDHVVPLVGKANSRHIVCGLHWEGNLQVL